jgi:uncharacterized protein (DUF1501 family)
MHRRSILKLIAAAPLALGATRLIAAPVTDARLLVVFMRGGYDAANLLVPVSSSFYYESRPNIAVAKPDTANPNAALALDADWGLHPALRENLYPLYQKSQAAFISFAGTDDLTRSHFETQDSIELGQPLQGTRNYNSGFLNRLAGVLNGSHPIAFTDQLPIVFNGETQIPNMALKSVGKPGVDSRQAEVIGSMYRKTALNTQVTEGFSVRDEVVTEMTGEMEAANRNAITTKGFELEARRIAKMMKTQFNIGFVDVGGWDTHVGEGGGSGYLAGRLEELGRGLAGYADEMGPAWNNTVVVVVSEFGRTFRENGNRGTDHGHGSVYWVLGGKIHGGRIAGEQVKVAQSTLFQNRDYPVLNEYRSIFGGVFARMYGLNTSQLDRIFAGVKPKDFALI